MAVDTVGNNLANVNTTGYKGSDVAFKDIVAESMGAQGESGMGVSRPIVVRNFSQGAIQTTSGSLDAAVQGSGFFVVTDGSGSRLLTRDGSFTLDRQGYVTTLTGERVQKYVNGVLSDIQIPTATAAAKPTSAFSMTANLNASAKVGDTFSTPMEVVDSLGVSHVLTVQFTKTDANEWEYDVKAVGAELGQTDPLVSVLAAPGTITFDGSGNMITPDADNGAIDFTVAGLANGANDMDLTWNLYNSDGASVVTQFAQASNVTAQNQDGYPSAGVVSVGMADGGRILAKYGNGQIEEIAVLAMALVQNPGSLSAAGNNMYRVGTDTAVPTFGTSGVGGLGKVKAGALEASTVDMAREFTNLIVYQRGYQANSRVITTADELSQEVLNLKR